MAFLFSQLTLYRIDNGGRYVGRAMWHGRQEWDRWEVETIQRKYTDPLCSREELLLALPGRSWKAIQCRAQKEGLSRPNPHHHAVNKNYFARIDAFHKAYDLGLLAADGTVLDNGAISLYLQKRDRVLVAQLRDRIAPDAPIYEYKNSYGVKIGCREMAADLDRYNITPRKSLTLLWPDLLPGEMVVPFLLGYFDGDGSLSIGGSLRRTRWSMLGTAPFLTAAHAKLQQLSGLTLSAPFRAGKRTPDLFVLATHGRKAEKIDRLLNASAYGLSRKHFAPQIVSSDVPAPPPI